MRNSGVQFDSEHFTTYTQRNIQYNRIYLCAVHSSVVLHVLLHSHADVSGGELAVRVAHLIQSSQGLQASLGLELGDLVAC